MILQKVILMIKVKVKVTESYIIFSSIPGISRKEYFTEIWHCKGLYMKLMCRKIKTLSESSKSGLSANL